MTFLDRIKLDLPEGVLVAKYGNDGGETDRIRWGSQLIVRENHEAVFFMEGKVVDVLGPGQHTLKTKNFPILHRLMGIPFGGETPFPAEVYVVNRTAQLDQRWGTEDRIPLLDPRFHVIVGVGARGQFGIRVADSRQLVTMLVGTLPKWDSVTLQRFFRGLLVSKLKEAVATAVMERRIGLLEINARLSEIGEAVQAPVAVEFERFGLSVVSLVVDAVHVPDDDPSMVKLRETMASRAEMEQLGDGYRVKRTFDTLEAAAASGGTTGSMLAGGLGIGLGLGAGPALGQGLGQTMGTGGPGTAPPAACACGAALPADALFCPSCGAKAAAPSTPPRFCTKCGNPMAPTGPFCSACGTRQP